MGWRKGHGNGKGSPRIEVLPADELPRPRPKVVGRGGATKIALARHLQVPTEKMPEKYGKMAEQFRKHQCKEIARQAGGRCGSAPSSMVASASLQLAASRWLLERGFAENDPSLLKMGSSLANDSRQNLLAAFELAARECTARMQFEKMHPVHALEEALTGPLLDAGPQEKANKKPKSEGSSEEDANEVDEGKED